MIRTVRPGPDALDGALILLFLAGIYLEYAPKLAAGVPLPAAPAGVAGALMLFRHRDRISERQLMALLAVIGLYLVSILCVPDTVYLKERLKGLVQIAYSLFIAYGLFITLIGCDRVRLARLLLVVCLAVLAGCALEIHTGFGAVSEAVRERLFDDYLYESSLRDETLYGGVRPKLFTSEPSYLAYGLTLYAFAWYVLSTSRFKLLLYVGILGSGLILVRSPTIVLGFAFILPYELFLAKHGASGRIGSSDTRAIKLILLTAAAAVLIAIAGATVFSDRLSELVSGGDPSVFARIIGPVLVGIDTVLARPLAGAGLTGEEYIAERVLQLYLGSPYFNPEWRIEQVSEVLTNFFWLHWIYLGLVWGGVLLWALNRHLRTLDVPSVTFCWSVWLIFGQASGAYVSPKPWTTLAIAGAVSVLHCRRPANDRRASWAAAAIAWPAGPARRRSHAIPGGSGR